MADRKRHWLCRPAFRPTRRRNGLSGRGGAAGKRQLLSVLPACLAALAAAITVATAAEPEPSSSVAIAAAAATVAAAAASTA